MTEREMKLVSCERDGTIASSCKRSTDIDEACVAMAKMYDQFGFEPPWIGYIAVSNGTAVGGGAFVGPPTDNRVEIAYFSQPDHQGRGIATQIAENLVCIARRRLPNIEIYAKTLPEENASTRILNRLNFRMIGTVDDHEIGEAWAWLFK